ncbi:aldehyde dehydrogenase family protein [Mycobacterium sp. 21AC1]|uniref:aldehyde dehydrogenase family protein n=1 Tax=[Mycobacterium] appelbergii TaxID=2939269 RepID=UPI002938FB16|nr:aldehyde dehydrogenase family protein [Mycobacterium sp. 21AC1]MDV3127250.1 aldehyde dehydrogenase family protein [Mycobacterium sp. 21AC1]
MSTVSQSRGVGTEEDVQVFGRLFIGGEWTQPHSGRLIESVDPSTEQVWAKIAEADEQDVDAAVAAARDALSGPWGRMSGSHRGALLLKLAELLRRDGDALAEIESRDNGKPVRDTRGEMLRSADWLTYFAGAADKIRGAQIPVNPDAHAYTVRQPVGVVGAILPWNSPISLATWKLAPALAAGNTLVLKPAELTSASALVLARLIEEAGFPSGVVNVVPGYGAIAGARLAEHPDVDKISFTGEHRTAQQIMRAAAGNLKRISFECGGKSPYIVFADADVDRALSVAVHSGFRSTGQSCSLASRVFVERSVYQDFARKLAERASRIRVGTPFDPKTHIGPHSSAEQLAKTKDFIEFGRGAGFRLLAGGGRPPGLDRGYFVEPTVFADVDHTSRLAQEEIFGPVLSVLPFDSEEEVVAMANGTRYGLVGGLWTSDVTRAHRIASQIETGLVSVNTFRPILPMLPYGGFKYSGIGRENGMEVLDEYTETKAVYIDLSVESPHDPFAD